jgi:hypothetical protein
MDLATKAETGRTSLEVLRDEEVRALRLRVQELEAALAKLRRLLGK